VAKHLEDLEVVQAEVKTRGGPTRPSAVLRQKEKSDAVLRQIRPLRGEGRPRSDRDFQADLAGTQDSREEGVLARHEEGKVFRATGSIVHCAESKPNKGTLARNLFACT